MEQAKPAAPALGEPSRRNRPERSAPAFHDLLAPADTTPDAKAQVSPPQFAHPSEAEFAAILDFYQLRWQYEPHSFPLRTNASGRVVERFTPDFYLPDLDLYIELTTLKQSLVTKKNRKLRRLRELHPDIQIKLVYKRDFVNLLRKFGLPIENVGTITPETPDDPAGDSHAA